MNRIFIFDKKFHNRPYCKNPSFVYFNFNPSFINWLVANNTISIWFSFVLSHLTSIPQKYYLTGKYIYLLLQTMSLILIQVNTKLMAGYLALEPKWYKHCKAYLSLFQLECQRILVRFLFLKSDKKVTQDEYIKLRKHVTLF